MGGEGEKYMRLSEGVPRGRIVELYNPDMFNEREEVIVFIRDDFNRTYTSMREQIDYINKTDLNLDRGEEWKLIGYWPKIMEKVQILDAHIDALFGNEPVQCYLDAYMYSTIESSKKNHASSESKVSVKW